jgi:DNA-directed RNA polymerase subunit RPC12/RpoP
MYMAIYECRQCEREEFFPRRYRYHFGPYCRCPECGTFRVHRLKARDKIDPLRVSLLNSLERLVGGRLYHCHFCRVQFYDRRMLAPEDKTRSPEEGQEVASPPGPADVGA